MPQYGYTRKIALNGQECDGYGPRLVQSYTNERLAQISTITLAGFDVGTYTIRMTSKDGRVIDIETTGPGVSIAATVAAIVASFDAADDLEDLENVVNILVATDASPDVVLDFIHPGEAWEISFPSNPNGNMSHDLTQAAGGTDVKVGVFVVQGSEDDLAKAPTGASTDANFVGLTIRNSESATMDYTTEDPVFEPADTMSVKKVGLNWVEVEDAVSVGSPVFARKSASANGTILGKPRSDADGGSAVQLSACIFLTSTTGAGLAKVQINRP